MHFDGPPFPLSTNVIIEYPKDYDDMKEAIKNLKATSKYS